MKLDRKSGVPFYIQLKEQIRKDISSSLWDSGQKLPTEREMAAQLEVSRNTVSQAYKELEAEGVLSSAQGRGTFVANSGAILQRESRKEKVLRIIDNAMEEAVALGFTLDDFISFVHVRGMEKKASISRLKLAILESNSEQLEEFSQQSNLGSGVTLVPMLLADLKLDPARARERLGVMDLVVTTFLHVNEVKAFLQDSKVPVIGVSLEPKLETMVRIARIQGDKPLLLVCDTTSFADKVAATLNQAGIHHDLEVLTTRDEEKLAERLAEYPVAVVSASRKNLVEKLSRGRVELIEFRTYPDAGSLNLLRSALLELKNN
jgi:DNA-binding transcriptional regulator YhcF (GntR family)